MRISGRALSQSMGRHLGSEVVVLTGLRGRGLGGFQKPAIAELILVHLPDARTTPSSRRRCKQGTTSLSSSLGVNWNAQHGKNESCHPIELRGNRLLR